MCGVPRSTLKKWRQQYLNGIYTEVTNDDIESFRATLWRDQQEVLAQQAFGAAKKILEQINGLLNAQTDSFQARDIKDMSLAFNKILGWLSGFTPGGQQAVAVSNVQIVLPPKMDELCDQMRNQLLDLLTDTREPYFDVLIQHVVKPEGPVLDVSLHRRGPLSPAWADLIIPSDHVNQ